MLRRAGQWQGNRSPDNQTANKLVDAGGSWFEDVGSTPTASILIYRFQRQKKFTHAREEATGVRWITLKGCEDPALQMGSLVSG